MEYKKVMFLDARADVINVEEYDNHVYLKSIIVKKDSRNKGVGSKIIKEIIAYAKNKEKPLVAFVSNELGGDYKRLVKWYKSFGFYEECNKIQTDFNYNMRIDW